MFSISIEQCLKELCPKLVLGTIFCEVSNTKFNKDLWNEIEDVCDEIRQTLKMEDVRCRPAISAIREAYKRTGKEPNRYRPAGEALTRRVLQGKNLFQINTLVDITNLISLKFGYSIGGFDADKVVGAVRVGIGKVGEDYNAIGRGKLNVAGMPILRDDIGGIGTPTSDENRTALTIETDRFYMNINAYMGREGLDEVMEYSIDILKKYVDARNFETRVVS